VFATLLSHGTEANVYAQMDTFYIKEDVLNAPLDSTGPIINAKNANAHTKICKF
jgi:hypothetical protein